VLRIEGEQARQVQARCVDRGAEPRADGQQVACVALRLREQVVVIDASHRERRHSFNVRLSRGARRAECARGEKECRDGCSFHIPGSSSVTAALPARLKCNNCSHISRSRRFANVAIAFPEIPRDDIFSGRERRVADLTPR
jgi:hypothetical protein